MAEQTRVRVYEGLYRSQSEDLFAADATEAEGHGWFPTDQTWVGSRLTVAYAHRRRPRRARRMDGTPRTLPLWMRVTYRAVVLGTATAAIILLIWVLGALAVDGGIS